MSKVSMERLREELIRIAGNEVVSQAESMSNDEFIKRKWECYAELVHCFDQFSHTNLFEARRSFLLSLDPGMKLLLIRHLFDEQNIDF